jgi:hypothetical protein
MWTGAVKSTVTTGDAHGSAGTFVQPEVCASSIWS